MFVESNLCRLVLLSNFCIILPSYRTTKEYIQTDLIPFHCCNIGVDMPVHISASLKCLVGETQKYWSGGEKKDDARNFARRLNVTHKFEVSFFFYWRVTICQQLSKSLYLLENAGNYFWPQTIFCTSIQPLCTFTGFISSTPPPPPPLTFPHISVRLFCNERADGN